MPKKKLIETVMPVSRINMEAEREKITRSGMPSSIHLWWSRRSMAAARSTLFASLVDDPSEHPELFPTETAQEQERQRLLELTEKLAAVEAMTDTDLLKAAEAALRRHTAGPLPLILDPFSGGGSIPVEAHRLGLSTESADLNPVAALITMAVTDIPCRFADHIPVHPREDMLDDMPLPGTQALAEDVLWYGKWMLDEARNRIGSLFPTAREPVTGRELPVSAWLWARTVKCPNPTCGCNIPLSSGYDLAKKKGCEAWVEPIAEDGSVAFRVHHGPRPAEKRRPKVAQSAVFQCPVCSEITTDAYVKECGKAHQFHSQLIAIAADNGNRRIYLSPTIEQFSAAEVSRPEKVPHGDLPNYPTRFTPPSFGLADYADLFTNRQLIFLTTMLELAEKVQCMAEENAREKGYEADGRTFREGGAGALAYGQAIRIILVLTISKLLDIYSGICGWNSSGGGSLRNVFSRAAIPMVWDYAEGNPFEKGPSSFTYTLERTCKSLAMLPTLGTSTTLAVDAAAVSHTAGAVISTELPYYDRVDYAELSDFFYVWLRLGVSDLFPQWFSPELSPKKEELTSFAHCWGGSKVQAEAAYAEGLTEALRNLCRSASSEYPSSLAYIYDGGTCGVDNDLTHWEVFLTALYEAGFVITASWPVGMERTELLRTAGERAVPVTVILRKQPEDAPHTTRRAFVALVKRELPEILKACRGHVWDSELRASVIGPALKLFMQYRKVLDADGSEMKPYMASRIIEQELDMLLSSQ